MFGKKPSKNAHAVVTGAGSGIGRAFALEIARRGGRVVCADINRQTAEETVAQIVAAGGEAKAVACDVAGLAAVERLAADAERWLGKPVDLVINNAGVGVGGKPVGDIPMDDWQWVMGINLWGVIHGCHVFVPKLRALGRGGIVNVASSASFGAAPSMGPYNVTKAGVLALSETLAAELSGSGVKISVLCPTFVHTNIARDARVGDSKINDFAQKLMDRTGIPPERVAKVTLDALDRGRLHVLPQFDARMLWRAKRLAPATYTRGMGLLSRFTRDLL
ncbi:MAG: SDR family NAD(P)-dependent oxidoreductase [Pseudomonadota bacterium]